MMVGMLLNAAPSYSDAKERFVSFMVKRNAWVRFVRPKRRVKGMRPAGRTKKKPAVGTSRPQKFP
jgi:hypothetical protein